MTKKEKMLSLEEQKSNRKIAQKRERNKKRYLKRKEAKKAS